MEQGEEPRAAPSDSEWRHACCQGVPPPGGGAVFSCHGSSVYLGLPRDCFDEVYAMDKVLLDNEEQKKNSS